MLYNAIIADSTTFHDELLTMQNRLRVMVAEYQAQYDAFDARIHAMLACDCTWTDDDDSRYDELQEQRSTLKNAIDELKSTIQSLEWAISEADYVDTLVEDLPDIND